VTDICKKTHALILTIQLNTVIETVQDN